MPSATSRVLLRADDGEPLPCAGVLGRLASPVPQDAALLEAFAALRPAELPGLLESIAFHRIDGLAHRAVGRLPGGSVPAWLRSSLRRRTQRFAAAALSQAMALADLLQALDRASLPITVMRGLRTGEGVYDDIALHPFEDHDLLVLPGDRDAARAVLRRLGYEQEAWGLFRRGGVIIDLHVDPLGAHRRPSRRAAFPIEVEALFSRALPGTVAGAPCLLLQPEDDLILLGIHLVKHSFDRLLRVADVAHFVFQKRSVLDWDLLTHRARSCGATRLLGWALEAAALVGVSARSEDRPAGSHDGWIVNMMMRRVLELRPFPYTGEALMAAAAGDLPARLRFLLDALWPAGERPAGVLRRTADLPRRVVHLASEGVSHAVDRRRR